MTPDCSLCGKTFSGFLLMYTCPGCRSEVYCSSRCAEFDQANHKVVCDAIQSLRESFGKPSYQIDKAVSSLSYKMLDDDRSVLRVMMLGGYRPLIKVVDASLTSGPMTQANLHFMANLCHDCPELRVPFTLEGGSLFAIRALKTYMNHPNSILRESACYCLELLANNPNTKSVLIHQGAAECIIETMQAHADDQFIQASGCSMLLSLGTTRKNRQIIVRLGGLQAVLKAASLNLQSSVAASISRFANIFVRRLYMDKEFDDELGKAGASALILN